MPNKTPSPKRIMAIDPGTQRLGIAILEGEELIWYGVTTFPGPCKLPHRKKSVQAYLTRLLQTYEPDVLAVEEPFYSQAMLSKNVRTLTEDIKTWGKWKGLRVYGYLPSTVKAYFCRDRKTQESLVEAMIEQYPFLARYHVLIPWDDRYWFRIFEAIAVGLMCSRKLVR